MCPLLEFMFASRHDVASNDLGNRAAGRILCSAIALHALASPRWSTFHQLTPEPWPWESVFLGVAVALFTGVLRRGILGSCASSQNPTYLAALAGPGRGFP
jgi:hypothetical protein